MSDYYQQLTKEINTFNYFEEKDKPTLEILGEVTAYQACNLITRNIEDDEEKEYISFKLEAYKSKKDGHYIEISSNAKTFFNKLIKERSFVKRLIIFPNKDYQNLLKENFYLPAKQLATYSKNDYFPYDGDQCAINSIKKNFKALVLDITEISFKENNQVILKGITSYSQQLSLHGYVT